MEKLLYLAYRADNQPVQQFVDTVLGPVSQRLLQQAGLRKLSMSVADAAVEPARPLRMQSSTRVPDALASVWMDTCMAHAPLEAVLGKHCDQLHGYLVTESEPLVNREHPAGDGERVYGMSQVAILEKPSRLTYSGWIDLWQGGHTQIAIDTQSTFGYRQNVIVRPLTAAAPGYHAIVEENFPPGAMTSSEVFYNAEGDEGRLKRHIDTMMESCARFIDFDKIDVIPMSEYVMRG